MPSMVSAFVAEAGMLMSKLPTMMVGSDCVEASTSMPAPRMTTALVISTEVNDPLERVMMSPSCAAAWASRSAPAP